MKKFIEASDNAIGVKELKCLNSLKSLDKMLSYDEFKAIVNIYQGVLERLEGDAKLQGVELEEGSI